MQKHNEDAYRKIWEMKNSTEVRYGLVSRTGSSSKDEGRWGEKTQHCNPLNPCIKGWDLCFKKKSSCQFTYTNLITNRHDNRLENGRIIRKQVTSSKRNDVNLISKISSVPLQEHSKLNNHRATDRRNKDVFTRLSMSHEEKKMKANNLKTVELQKVESQRHCVQPSTSESTRKHSDVQKHMSDFINKLLTENSQFKDAYGNIIALLNDINHLSDQDYMKTISKISKLEASQIKGSEFDFKRPINYKSEFLEKDDVSCDQVVNITHHSRSFFKLENPNELLDFDFRKPLLQELKNNEKYSKILQHLPLKLSISDHSSSTTSTPVVKMRKNFRLFKPTLSKSVKSLNNCFNQPTSPTSPVTPSKTRQSLSSLLNLFKPNFIRFSRSSSETTDDTRSVISCQEDPNYFDYDIFPRPLSLSKYRRYDRHHMSINLHPSKFTPPLANFSDDQGEGIDICIQHPLRSVTSEPNNINHQHLKFLDDSDEDDDTDINNNNNKNNKSASRVSVTPWSRIVVDILKAENDYVTNVDNIVEGFLYKCFGVLSDDDIRKVFGNIEHLRHFCMDFVAEMRKCVEEGGVDDACIGALFIHNHRRFEVYVEYCLNNQTSSACLSAINNVDECRLFFEKCRRERGMIELPLQAFLLTPVQKICKYPLQLKQLYRCTPDQHQDHANLKLAIELMLSLANKINEIKKLQELRSELLKCGSIVGWKGPELSRLSSSLTHTGHLTKLSGRGWQHHRVCFLFTHQMLVCKKDLIRKNILLYKEHLLLKHVKLQENLYKDMNSRLVSLPNGFGMLDQLNSKQHYWLCSNQDEKARWLRAIRQLLK